jgi:hypothetical protein
MEWLPAIALSYDSVAGSEGVTFRAKGGRRSPHSGKSHALGSTQMFPLPCCPSYPRRFGAERCLVERRGVTLVGGNIGAEAGECAGGEHAGNGCVVKCSFVEDVDGSLVILLE